MMRMYCVLVTCLMFGGAPWQAKAEPLPVRYANTDAPTFMRIYGPAQPPYGFVQFCDANPSQCATRQNLTRLSSVRFDATPQRLSELDEVNRIANEAVEPFTDQEIYGISEYWTMPTTRGDCEDYALLKRDELAKRGWPLSSLLLTVVRDEVGDGHAVLTVRTRQGDFILDNKISDVRLWSATPYEFVMRQSYVNPRVWVSLDHEYSADLGFRAGAARNR